MNEIKQLEAILGIKSKLNYHQLDELVKKYERTYIKAKKRYSKTLLKSDRTEFLLFKSVQFFNENRIDIIEKSPYTQSQTTSLYNVFSDYIRQNESLTNTLWKSIVKTQELIDIDYLEFFQDQQNKIIANKASQLKVIEKMIQENEKNKDSQESIKSVKDIEFAPFELEKFNYEVNEQFYEKVLKMLVDVHQTKEKLIQIRFKIRRFIRIFYPEITYLNKYLKTARFDIEYFTQNVKYKTFADGSQKKIVADIKDIQLHFVNPAVPGQKNKVLRGASIDFYEGCVHAIIGESGSGKSVLTSLLYGLTGDNARIDSGTVKLYNHEIQDFDFKRWEKSKYRGTIVSAVFQNPMSTLNPTMKIGQQIMEGMLVNKIVKSKKEAREKAIEYLKMTKINNAEEIINLYPFELSGGMIQRVVIAAIIALEPKIIVLDEPTTALDPTVQALVLDIIRELQQKLQLTIVFITHDLGVVASISDYIAIMYAGEIIEEGKRDEILLNAQHPYTWGLIMSMPDINKGHRLSTIRGSVPSSLNDIRGDAFAVRNDYALGIDFVEEPKYYYLSETHRVKSALLDPKAPKYTPPKPIQEKWNTFKEESNV